MILYMILKISVCDYMNDDIYTYHYKYDCKKCICIYIYMIIKMIVYIFFDNVFTNDYLYGCKYIYISISDNIFDYANIDICFQK